MTDEASATNTTYFQGSGDSNAENSDEKKSQEVKSV